MGNTEATAPRFSVLLPTHNRADVLPFAIRSVLGQTMRDFELLIVGDGCTDGTAEVVASLGDPRIRWFDLPKAPNFGYANRNIALRAARGDLIAFMAHDDIWLPDHLAMLGRHFTSPAIELAYSRTLWVAPDGTITPSAFNLFDRETLHRFLMREANSISATCVIHRRECLARYGYWDEALPRNGDWDMWARIIEGGGKRNFAYEPLPTCLHFRAIWKTEATAGPPEIHAWRALRARGILPATLPAVPIGPGEPEQATTWRALAPDPTRWTQALRDSTFQVLDQCVAQAHLFLAIEDKDRHIHNLEGAIGGKDQHIANLEHALAVKDQYIGNLEATIPAKEQALLLLNQVVDARTRHLAHLERASSESACRLASLEQTLADRDRQRQQADQRLAELESAIVDKDRHINRIEGRLPVRLYRRVRRLIR